MRQTEDMVHRHRAGLILKSDGRLCRLALNGWWYLVVDEREGARDQIHHPTCCSAVSQGGDGGQNGYSGNDIRQSFTLCQINDWVPHTMSNNEAQLLGLNARIGKRSCHCTLHGFG